MANTTTKGKQSVTVATLDTDFTFTTLFSDFANLGGAYIKKIQFYPGAANDRCILREGADDGIIIFDSAVDSGTGDSRVDYFDEPREIMNPKFDANGTGVICSAGCYVKIDWA
jgi:hypothetical protein